ncbi:hypothetical protein ATCV1_z524R [Acanthocystis turfacea chlorella virus 1]|uniref:Uncharacterized protein z524R n=1 Tax=Chlorovirus heliozoae TaxID=322019 RepID=A7K9D4_9PHYC|nr:hypothetical protein ATCV1_z524R [Acanthocystis turfacea chlorella virus 1]ABT16658.1 hypothetical protein ATCV1_z524R [Acanthocystis turfacea chlorella virus 1]
MSRCSMTREQMSPFIYSELFSTNMAYSCSLFEQTSICVAMSCHATRRAGPSLLPVSPQNMATQINKNERDH